MSRRMLIILLTVLAAVPVLTGLLAIVGGPTVAPGGGATTASVDSEYRFVNTFWVAAGLALGWSLRRPSERAMVTRVLLVVASVGGISRLISVVIVGWPHPVYIGSLVLELVIVPLMILWHARMYPLPKRPLTPSSSKRGEPLSVRLPGGKQR